VDVKASYLEVPAMAKFTFGESSVRPSLMVGPSIGFLLSAEQTAEFIDGADEDISDTTEDIEFGLTGGGGLEFDLGDSSVDAFVQARYYLGLSDTHTEEENHKSRGFKFVAGLSFPIGG